MAKSTGTKSSHRSLNKNAPSRSGLRGAKVLPKAMENPTAGGNGDKDGKGDIRAKQAGTSIAKRNASK